MSGRSAASRKPRRQRHRYRSSAKAGVGRPSGDTLAAHPLRSSALLLPRRSLGSHSASDGRA